jgi:hypothetical protein
MMSRSRRRVRTWRASGARSGLVAGALLLAIGSSACAHGSNAAGVAILTYDEAMAEYRTATEQLELAPGGTWIESPTVLQAVDETGQPNYYEAGVGAQQADFQWFCSWAAAMVGSSGAAREAAMQRLGTFPEHGVWEKMDDNGHHLFTTMLADADLGDLSGLTGYLSVNCR